MTRRLRPANFDRVARPYRWLEYLSFGRSLERCRNHYLAQLGGCRSALVLGDGDGRFLARLLATNPSLTADAVDSSAAMLRLLERRAQAAAADSRSRLRIHQADALSFGPQRDYDLVVTHFFLDCLTQAELDGLCARIGPHLPPRALWVFSDFRIPAGAIHWPARAIVRLLYLAFQLLTGLQTHKLPDHAATLSAAGFARIARHLSLAGLLTTELWEYTPAMLPPQHPKAAPIADPLPDPEPVSPSLPEPDPAVFHRQLGKQAPEPQDPRPSDEC
jgi:SAM-dependent methyltransferase